MRKIFIKMASIVLIFVMCLTSLVGCGLITTDSERDMNQVVATVQIDKDAPKDVIYKKDMVLAYMNYGYIYEQQYGYSSADTFKLIIDSLVNNRVLVQSVIKAQYVEAKGWDIDEYLSAKSKLEAEYTSIKAMNDLIESYIEHDHDGDEKADSLWETVRTTPTNATVKVKELTDAEKQSYINEGVKIETAEQRKAYNKVIELMRINELLGDGYKVNDITTTDYYKETLTSAKESELISAYEKTLKQEVMARYDFTALSEAYKQKYDAQMELSTTDLVAKFSSATASDPILVGANGSYGYVYNLLLGVDDVLSGEISSIKTDLDKDNLTKEEYAQARKEILNATVITDQRSTWIASGYDFNGTTFENDYTFVEGNSLPFQGVAEKIKDKDTEKDELYDKYKVTSLTEFSLDGFVNMMEGYVYGSSQTGEINSNPSVFKQVNSQATVADYDNKINELLFAFSTDPGSLNTYKGYLIKPVPEGSESEEYMQEFADGARELITMGGSSYIMVATDYGYHVMFYSEILNRVNYDFDSLEKYLDDLYGDKTLQQWESDYGTMLSTWDDFEDTDNYMYLLASSLFSTEASNAVTKYQRETLNAYRYSNDSGVILYESRYADLLA